MTTEVVHLKPEACSGSSPLETRASPIGASWKRCVETYALSPDVRPERRVLSGAELSRRHDHLAPLMPLIDQEIARLMPLIDGSGYALLVTDADGVILRATATRQAQPAFERAGLVAGGLWDEASRGTNGIGTCLVERKPTLVHGADHFLAHHAQLSCSAAPILDEQNRVLAILDASVVDPPTGPEWARHTLAMVENVAHRLERIWFQHNHQQEWIFQLDMPHVGSVLFVLDEQGTITGLDPHSRRQHGILIGLLGAPVTALIDPISFDALKKTQSSALAVPLFRAGALLGYGRLVARRDSTETDTTILPPLTRAANPTLDRLHHSEPQLSALTALALKLVNREVPLIIQGETGSGKGWLAQALHQASHRRHGPFVSINCSAIPRELIESELFGYVKGAFTGANPQGAPGRIVDADGGILFLDEIGDMPLDLQTRLLTVLETREVIPVGGRTPRTVDFLVMSATHQDLERKCEEGSFRRDLFYRLKGHLITLPALRQRSDLPALIVAIFAELMAERSIAAQLSTQTINTLTAQRWPGNLRELRQSLRVLSAIADQAGVLDHALACAALSLEPEPVEPNRSAFARHQRAMTEELIAQTLEATSGNMTEAAKRLGLSRRTLYRKLQS